MSRFWIALAVLVALLLGFGCGSAFSSWLAYELPADADCYWGDEPSASIPSLHAPTRVTHISGAWSIGELLDAGCLKTDDEEGYWTGDIWCPEPFVVEERP